MAGSSLALRLNFILSYLLRTFVTRGVTIRNSILVAMEDLVEADRKELERELEEEMAEARSQKLACFQKTRNGVVKKADTMVATSAKVNAQLNLEDLIHMVDVLVASKYGADLTQFTRVVAKDMRNTLDAFKTDLNSSFPRHIRSVVQQISLQGSSFCTDLKEYVELGKAQR
jgi:hypothetical protein